VAHPRNKTRAFPKKGIVTPCGHAAAFSFPLSFSREGVSSATLTLLPFFSASLFFLSFFLRPSSFFGGDAPSWNASY